MPQLRALLVGIDQYPDPRNNLNSCVNDTLAFRNMLMSSYGFNPGDITLLHNRDATLDRVRTALDTLCSGVTAGDRIVFFDSSHGYRFPRDNDLIEVICLYDQFLEDKELVDRSQTLPPGVLTAVCDCCHGGGLNKLFFPPGGTAAARTKVWQPPVDRVTDDLQLLQQVSRFKFFGRAATRDTGTIVKQFSTVPEKNFAAAKGGEGGLDLNGLLFAACQADETAAAGSPPTNNLSAFTFALLDQLAVDLAVADLRDRATARLRLLNMNQTPVTEAPALHPEQLTEALVTFAPTTTGAPPHPSNGGPSPSPSTGFDPAVLAQFLSGLTR
jgi:hypothetical protein